MSATTTRPRGVRGDGPDRARDLRAGRADDRLRGAARRARGRGLARWAGPCTGTTCSCSRSPTRSPGSASRSAIHRLFTHRSFKTTRAGAGAAGGARLDGGRGTGDRVGRRPTASTTATRTIRGDPHSPHVDQAPGWRGALRGLAHAHVGWMFRGKDMANPARYAKDLLADRDLRFISRTFPLWVAAGLAVPFGLGVALTGTIAGGLTGLLWGGAVRMLLLHHVDVQHQLAVPLLRPAAVRHRRRVAQPRVAGPVRLRRGLAQQPPRVPNLGPSRPRPPPGRPQRLAHRRRWSAATWPGTSSGSAPGASRPSADPQRHDLHGHAHQRVAARLGSTPRRCAAEREIPANGPR